MASKDQARLEGMAYALQIARERGVDGLEEELRFRNITGIKIGIPRSACDEAIQRIKINTIDTIVLLSMVVLREKFGFGPKRMAEFINDFNFRSECLEEGYVTWEDLRQQMKEELKIERTIRWNR